MAILITKWNLEYPKDHPNKDKAGKPVPITEEAIKNDLLIIPGNVFSPRDTHFRLSYAADDRTLQRGVEVLKKIVKQ